MRTKVYSRSLSYLRVLAKLLQSCLTLCDPMDCSCQAPLSMGFSRQEYWSGSPCPPPGDLPDPWIKPMSPVLAGSSLPLAPPGKATVLWCGAKPPVLSGLCCPFKHQGSQEGLPAHLCAFTWLGAAASFPSQPLHPPASHLPTPGGSSHGNPRWAAPFNPPKTWFPKGKEGGIGIN